MKSGYKILWTDNALQELEATLNYLKEKWTAKELKNLAVALEKTLQLIAQNPYIFQASVEKKEIRSLTKRIEEHELKIKEFKANPTVRPGMEKLPKEIIEKQQLARIRHLQQEIRAFQGRIDFIKNKGNSK